jgi:hypothetical protein
MDSLLLDDSITAGNTTDKAINLVFGHFTFFDMILLTF